MRSRTPTDMILHRSPLFLASSLCVMDGSIPNGTAGLIIRDMRLRWQVAFVSFLLSCFQASDQESHYEAVSTQSRGVRPSH